MQLVDTWYEIVPAVMLSAAVVIGALTAFARLTDRNTPFDIGLLHGRMGAAAVIFIILLMISGDEVSASAKPALALLSLTVISGATLYFIIRRKGILPKTIIFAHGALAVSGLTVLLFGLPY